MQIRVSGDATFSCLRPKPPFLADNAAQEAQKRELASLRLP
jgi:hypothetical protein